MTAILKLIPLVEKNHSTFGIGESKRRNIVTANSKDGILFNCMLPGFPHFNFISVMDRQDQGCKKNKQEHEHDFHLRVEKDKLQEDL